MSFEVIKEYSCDVLPTRTVISVHNTEETALLRAKRLKRCLRDFDALVCTYFVRPVTKEPKK